MKKATSRAARGIAASLCASALIVGLAGCTSPSDDSPPVSQDDSSPGDAAESAASTSENGWSIQLHGGETLIAPEDGSSSGPGLDALATGVLGVSASGCWGIARDGSAEVFLVAFPLGTVLRSDGTVQFNGLTFAQGDRVELGGGWVNAESIEWPTQCDAERVFVAGLMTRPAEAALPSEPK